ncbi:MAG: ribosomal-processing cysteine protease Prp [Ruminococcaceae bacterium]|nr:ribosomal-processing cysteine protease Prp [Oscillospiraceae bacterium]
MIKFTTVSNTDGKITQFTVDGHSGFSESGSDIVCASVSSAVWLTINGIEKQNLAQLSYEERDGFVKCIVSEKRRDGADVLLNSLVMFIAELSGQYKEYVNLTQS